MRAFILLLLATSALTQTPRPALTDHGFVRPDSWTDEYRRILDLFLAKLPKP